MNDDNEDHDEIEIERSPLSTKVTRDGMTVEIEIYRLVDEEGWLLEVIDEDQGCTVWNDLFDTDQEALDEAMKTIEEEGIASFLREPGQKLN